MSTSYRPSNSLTTGHAIPSPITALSFDPVSDALWTGSNTGIVTALYTSRGYRGVFFPVGGKLAVSKISAGDNYVRALGLASEGLGSWAKGGMNKWFYQPSSAVTTFTDALNSSHSLVLSTAGLEVLFLNSMTGQVVRKVPTSSMITHLQYSSSLLLSGSSEGYLRVHDPRTGMTRSGGEHIIKAHQSSIQGLQAATNYVFTIGHGERQSRPFPDPLVKVYDLRTMRPLPPIPFSSNPAFIHVLPKRPSSIAVVSNQGLINIVDVTNPNAPSEFYQLNLTSYMTSMSISPTGTYMALGDADGSIHLMTQAEEGSNVPFNGFDGQPVTWIDSPAPLPDIEWSESTPLNSIGVPYFDAPLLSAWTPLFTSANISYPPSQKIPPQVLNTMKMNDNVAYAALPKELRGRRNVVNTTLRKPYGRFRSGQTRNGSEDFDNIFDDTADEIPLAYRRVEIEYSKFGVEDFDFGYYNKTFYSGLETHILNSYTNAVVQVMHYLRPIRTLAKSHITTNCLRENCLLCELGFVVRMLEDARGTNCQASNFCKVVGALAQAANAIELVDYGRETTDVNYSYKIQAFNRFLVDRISSESNHFPYNPILIKQNNVNGYHLAPVPSPITQLMGIDGKNVITCMSCKAMREKDNMTHTFDLIYPRKQAGNEQPMATDFATILRNSLLRNISHKATCSTCRQFATFSSKRYIPSRDLPPILVANACVYNEETYSFWQDGRSQTFLLPQVDLHGQIDDVDDPEVASYVIRAIVVQIKTKDKASHLVAIVKVPEAEEKGDSRPWYIFNDFVVNNVSEEEALGFSDQWKVPAIVYLERANLHSMLDFGHFSDHMDPNILCHDTSISINRDPGLIKHDPLRQEELPTPGTLVAIDAEFVKMQQEESEYRSDGTNKVIRPARLSLARVSVLRGDGPRQGVPFIDDHIHTSELIVDYLTEYSGIKPGDLDPVITRMTLTPLKIAYKKLRLLVDRGCIFIGHGLSKDFRIINIYVPPEQVIDTVDLYFIKSRQRRLSLRFLSWFVLGEHIQMESHDSIEDARSALRLFKAFQSFEEQGIFDQKLEELYKEGRQYNYKPPPPPSHSVSPSLPDHGSPHVPSPFPYVQPTAILDPHIAHLYTIVHPVAAYALQQQQYQASRNWRK